MPQLVEESDDGLEAQREIIRQSLDAIANDTGMAMRDAGLSFPVYVTVGNSGDSYVMMATPLDPSDDDWTHASAIVCRVIGKRLGGVRLRGRPMACAAINAPMTAADLTSD